MDLTYLYAVVAFLWTTFELATALTGQFVPRKDSVLRKSQTTSAGRAGRRRQQLMTKSGQPEQSHGR